MMLPGFLRENLFDDWMNEAGALNPRRFFEQEMAPLYGKHGAHMMKTDIRDKEDGYEIVVDLPGVKKENIQARLENGYLSISAEKSLDKEEKNEEGRYIRRERYSGSCSRSFYVGDAVKQEDITARFEDGVLTLSVPKVKELESGKDDNLIRIEG